VVTMAIVSFVNYRGGQSRGCMKAVMAYTMQDKKTAWDDTQLVTGINCDARKACEDFMATKKLYRKTDGVLFFHMVQIFPKGEKVSPAAAHAAALKLAEYYKGHEVLVCTHTDREHIHSHFIINSVSLDTGRKLHIAKEQLQELRQRNDDICSQLGLPVFQSQPKKDIKSMSNAEYHSAAKGESWKMQLMNTIDSCMRYAADRQQFLLLMRSEGYDVHWADSRKNITYITPGGRKCRDNKLHEEKYLKENMEYEFTIRTEIIPGGAENEEQQRPDDRSGYRAAGHAEREELGSGDSAAGKYSERAERKPTVSENSADRSGCGTASDESVTAEQAAAGAVPEDGKAIRNTGWEYEREVFFRLAGLGSERQSRHGLDDPESTAADYGHYEYGPAGNQQFSGDSAAQADEGFPALCGSHGLAGDLIRLGRALELSANAAPSPAPFPTHSDRKARRKEREKKIALGHKPDDHEEQSNWQQTM